MLCYGIVEQQSVGCVVVVMVFKQHSFPGAQFSLSLFFSSFLSHSLLFVSSPFVGSHQSISSMSLPPIHCIPQFISDYIAHNNQTNETKTKNMQKVFRTKDEMDVKRAGGREGIKSIFHFLLRLHISFFVRPVSFF